MLKSNLSQFRKAAALIEDAYHRKEKNLQEKENCRHIIEKDSTGASSQKCKIMMHIIKDKQEDRRIKVQQRRFDDETTKLMTIFKDKLVDHAQQRYYDGLCLRIDSYFCLISKLAEETTKHHLPVQVE